MIASVGFQEEKNAGETAKFIYRDEKVSRDVHNLFFFQMPNIDCCLILFIVVTTSKFVL